MPPPVGSTPRSGHKYFFVVSFSTGFARAVHSFSTPCREREDAWSPLSRGSRRGREYNDGLLVDARKPPILVALVIWACAVSAEAAADATLFRLFLKDGSAVVSYGEYTRVDDRVVFSMPVGGSAGRPRLQVVWIPAASVDWPRTDRYAQSARYQHYADTQGRGRLRHPEQRGGAGAERHRPQHRSHARPRAGGAGANRPGRVAEAAPRLPPGRRPRNRRAHRRGDRRTCAPPAAPPPSTVASWRRRPRCRSSRCSACRRLREQLDQVLRLAGHGAQRHRAGDAAAERAGDGQRKRCRPAWHRADGDAGLARDAHPHRSGRSTSATPSWPSSSPGAPRARRRRRASPASRRP